MDEKFIPKDQEKQRKPRWLHWAAVLGLACLMLGAAPMPAAQPQSTEYPVLGDTPAAPPQGEDAYPSDDLPTPTPQTADGGDVPGYGSPDTGAQPSATPEGQSAATPEAQATPAAGETLVITGDATSQTPAPTAETTETPEAAKTDGFRLDMSYFMLGFLGAVFLSLAGWTLWNYIRVAKK